MVYSVDYITRSADCDLLLNWAEKEKADLTFKRYSEERLTTTLANTSIEVAAPINSKHKA